MGGAPVNADLVVKVGGSLARVDAEVPVMETLASAARRLHILVVSGGGEEADKVRDAYRRGDLDLVEAHWEAIRSLDRMGARLAVRCDGRGESDDLMLCASAEDCGVAWSQGRLALLAPYVLFDRLDPLPHRWDVTSDSVAGWIAEHFAASDFLLVKARDPRSGGSRSGEAHGVAATGRDADPAADPGAAPAPGSEGGGSAGTVDPAAAVEEELVDPYFPTVLQRADFRARCWIVNGQHPERLAGWLDTGSVQGLWRMPVPGDDPVPGPGPRDQP